MINGIISTKLEASAKTSTPYQANLGKWRFESMNRVGQNHIYTVYIRYFWQEIHQIYGHIRCIYTVLANPKYKKMFPSGTEPKTLRKPVILHQCKLCDALMYQT